MFAATTFGFGQSGAASMLAAIPDAPSAITAVATPNPYATMLSHATVLSPRPTSFFAGRSYTDPPLRTNREIVRSKSYRWLNLAIWGSVGADLARNWNNYRHDQPHGGELLIDALVPAAVNSAMVFGSYKYIWAPLGVGTAGYGIFVNTRSAINGVYF
jgi:hypothetical protein